MGRDEEFALRFEAGARAGEVFPLPAGREIIVGRAPDLDITLDDSRVSRRHAAIVIDGGQVAIRDLDSRNGIFVNGQRSEKARLKPGDRVRIGASVIVLEVAVPVEPARPVARAIAGRLDQITVVAVLEQLVAEERTGRLTLRGAHDHGSIYLRHGHISFASIETQPEYKPRKAFFRLVAWRSGAYEFDPSDPGPVDLHLGESTRDLLHEVPQYLETLAEMRDKLPLPDASLLVPSPPPGDLKQLTADEFTADQLVRKHGTLQGVLDHSPGTDLEATWHFSTLLERGFIELR